MAATTGCTKPVRIDGHYMLQPGQFDGNRGGHDMRIVG